MSPQDRLLVLRNLHIVSLNKNKKNKQTKQSKKGNANQWQLSPKFEQSNFHNACQMKPLSFLF